LSEEQQQELRTAAITRPTLHGPEAASHSQSAAGIAAKDHSLVGRQESVVYQPTAQSGCMQLQTRAQGGAFPRPALRWKLAPIRALPADATAPTRVVLLYLDEHLVRRIALDNWSVHINERGQLRCKPVRARIQLLFQPTYAPWTNPIEKVWLRFNEDVSPCIPIGPSGSALTTG